MKKQLSKIASLFIISIVLFGCAKDDRLDPKNPILPGQVTDVYGFYLLNEGNWGSNKASLDYFDYATGVFKRNIYGEVNPEVTRGLGDVGNDIQIHGSRLYIVVNASNKVEILDAKTAKKIGQVDITNPRYITFKNNKAYVTAYEGYVAVIDTASLLINKKINVGQQPEEMAILNNKLYVANSGGYNAPNYESTVSVIDLATETEIKKIDVEVNLNRLKADIYGDIYVTSRGDYGKIKSDLYVIDTKTDLVKKKFDIRASNFIIFKDYAYVLAISYDENWNTVASYTKINVKDESVTDGNFITDGSDIEIMLPYGVSVNPITEDFYVTDAKDYVTTGKLYAFDKFGKKKFELATGDIPAHLVFYSKIAK